MKHFLSIGTSVLLILPASEATRVSLARASRPIASNWHGLAIDRSSSLAVPIGVDPAHSHAQKRPAATPKKKKKDPTAAKTPAKTAAKPPAFVWPIADRKILHKYGERTNPTTNTVTVNPGIDISSKKGTDVKAAAAGVVSLVSWLPMYGTFVIVEHKNQFRSVYANLASTAVQKGDEVEVGTKIGAVGATAGGSYLHFEIWRDTTRLDPARHLPKSGRK